MNLSNKTIPTSPSKGLESPIKKVQSEPVLFHSPNKLTKTNFTSSLNALSNLINNKVSPKFLACLITGHGEIKEISKNDASESSKAIFGFSTGLNELDGRAKAKLCAVCFIYDLKAGVVDNAFTPRMFHSSYSFQYANFMAWCKENANIPDYFSGSEVDYLKETSYFKHIELETSTKQVILGRNNYTDRITLDLAQLKLEQELTRCFKNLEKFDAKLKLEENDALYNLSTNINNINSINIHQSKIYEIIYGKKDYDDLDLGTQKSFSDSLWQLFENIDLIQSNSDNYKPGVKFNEMELKAEQIKAIDKCINQQHNADIDRSPVFVNGTLVNLKDDSSRVNSLALKAIIQQGNFGMLYSELVSRIRKFIPDEADISSCASFGDIPKDSRAKYKFNLETNNPSVVNYTGLQNDVYIDINKNIAFICQFEETNLLKLKSNGLKRELNYFRLVIQYQHIDNKHKTTFRQEVINFFLNNLNVYPGLQIDYQELDKNSGFFITGAAKSNSKISLEAE